MRLAEGELVGGTIVDDMEVGVEESEPVTWAAVAACLIENGDGDIIVEEGIDGSPPWARHLAALGRSHVGSAHGPFSDDIAVIGSVYANSYDCPCNRLGLPCADFCGTRYDPIDPIPLGMLLVGATRDLVSDAFPIVGYSYVNVYDGPRGRLVLPCAHLRGTRHGPANGPFSNIVAMIGSIDANVYGCPRDRLDFSCVDFQITSHGPAE